MSLCTGAQHVPGDTPIVTELREALDMAFLEAERALVVENDRPTFHVFAKRFHEIAEQIADLTGVDPRASLGECQ